MISIKAITAIEILDSRGNPTVEATVFLSDGNEATASVPSGASIGKYEAHELRDRDEDRFAGKGVLTAVNNIVTKIGPKLIGMDVVKQGKIDAAILAIDGTKDKSNLGANAILAVSAAVCKAAAVAVHLPLYKYVSEILEHQPPDSIDKMPTPTFNIINGGRHGIGNLDIQEFHVIPATTKSYHEALQIGDEIYVKLKEVLMRRNAIHAVGDEGGYTPNLYTNLDALEAIMDAIRMTKYRYGFDVFLGLDVAADSFYKNNYYHIKDQPTALSTDEFIGYLENLHHEYHLLVLEDPLVEDDWQSWQVLTSKMGKEVHIIGDDLLATNPERLKRAIKEKTCNGILVKPNQIGTVSETLQVVEIAKAAGFKVIISHRSGETNDDFIADFAVGVKAEYVKFGAPARGERVAKYNRLLHIEKELKLT